MNLALFDFDGTITRNDTWTGFLRFSTTRPRMVATGVVLSPVIIGYKLEWIQARKARPAVARLAFRGREVLSMEQGGGLHVPVITTPRRARTP